MEDQKCQLSAWHQAAGWSESHNAQAKCDNQQNEKIEHRESGPTLVYMQNSLNKEQPTRRQPD
jgi:hypothetical protein